MTTLDAIIRIASDNNISITANDWRDRVYLDLDSANRRNRGDRSVKLYIINDNLMISDDVKGTISTELRDDVRCVVQGALDAGIRVTSRKWGHIARDMDTVKSDRV